MHVLGTILFKAMFYWSIPAALCLELDDVPHDIYACLVVYLFFHYDALYYNFY